MPRYFFHVVNGHNVLSDPIGMILHDVNHATITAEDIIAEIQDEIDGEPTPNFDHWHLRICREDGTVLKTIPLKSNSGSS